MKLFFIIASLLCLVLMVNADGTCASANCQVCRGGAKNALDALPRPGNNLVTSGVFGIAEKGKVDVNSLTKNLQTQMSNPATPGGYATGLGIYPAIAVLAAILVIPCMCFTLCCRCCCWKTHPRTGSCCGFDPETKKYSACNRATAYILMILFIGATSAWAAIAQFQGNQGFVDGAKANIITAADPTAQLVTGVTAPIATVATTIISSNLRTMLISANGTISNAVDVNALSKDVTCVLGILDQNIPNVVVIQKLVNDTKALIAKLPTPLDIDHLSNMIGNATKNIPLDITPVSNALTALTNVLNVLPGDLTQIKTARINVNTTLNKVDLVQKNITTEYGYLSKFFNVTRLTYIQGVAADPSKIAGLDASHTAARAAFKATLTSLNADATPVPQTIDTLSSVITHDLSNLINQAKSQVTGVSSVAADVKTQVNKIPSAASVTLSINGLKTEIGKIDFAFIRSLLTKAKTALLVLPNVGPTIIELSKVAPIANKTYCIHGIANIARKIKTLVSLPQLDSLNIDSLASNLDNQVSTVIGSVDTVKKNLISVNTTLHQGFNVDSMFTTVDNTQRQINSTLPNLDAVKSQLSSLNVNVPDLSGILQNITNSFGSVDLTKVNSLNSVKSSASGLNSTLVNALAAIHTWETTGVCMCTPANMGTCTFTACTRATDCTGHGNTDFCTAAMYPAYCKSKATGAFAVCYPSNATNCDSTFPCHTPDLGSLSTTIGNAKTNVQSAPSKDSLTVVIDRSKLTQLDSSLVTAQSVVDKLNGLDIPGKQATLTSVKSQLTSFDFTSQLSSIKNINTQFDPTTVQANIDKVNAFKGTIPTDQLNQLSTYIGLMGHFFSTDLGFILGRFSAGSLNTVVKTNGLTGLVTHVVQTINTVKSNVVAGSAPIDASFITNVIASVENSKSISDNGGLFYFATLLSQIPYVGLPFSSVIDPPFLTGGTVLLDNAGKARPMSADGKVTVCITTSCLTNSIDYYYSKSSLPIPQDALPVPIVGPIVVKVFTAAPMESLIAVPIAILLVPVVIGLLSMFWCGCSGKWSPAICTSLSACLISIPVLLFTAVLLIGAMTLGDACRSGEDIGISYSAQNAPTICTDRLKGTFDANTNLCTVKTSDYFIPISFDIKEIAAQVLGNCATDPVAAVFASVGSNGPVIANNLKTLVDQLLVAQNVTLGADLKALYATTFTNIGTTIQSSSGTLSEAVTCKKLNTAVIGMKDGVCCGVVNPLSTIALALLGAGLSLVCLGIPAGVYGKKKFSNTLWGEEYDEAVSKTNGGGGGIGPGIQMNTFTPGGSPAHLSAAAPMMVSPMAVNEVGGYDLDSFEKEYDVSNAALEPFDVAARSPTRGSLGKRTM